MAFFRRYTQQGCSMLEYNGSNFKINDESIRNYDKFHTFDLN